MKRHIYFLTFISLLFFIHQVHSMFLMPSIYGNKPANKLICQNTDIDISAGPTSSSRKPYLWCANKGKLKILYAKLVLSDRDTCPLQYTGTHEGNFEGKCTNPYSLYNTDATKVIKTLCDGTSECAFVWKNIPNLACSDGNIEDLLRAYEASNKNKNYNRIVHRIRRDVNQHSAFIENKSSNFDDTIDEYSNEDDSEDSDNSDYEDYTKQLRNKINTNENPYLEDYNQDEDKLGVLILRYIAKNDQALNVTYTCDNARQKFRPFTNKRYDKKFSPSFRHPLRTLSYNRLNQL